MAKNFLLLLALTSCDYFLKQKVLVINSSTKVPVDNARVKIGDHQKVTDSTGFCQFGVVTGNFSTRTIEITKEGFQRYEIRLKVSGSEITYSQKLDSIYTPVYSFGALHDTLVVYLIESKNIRRK
jgi:hypothetical protein